jgi:hypothetical protein
MQRCWWRRMEDQPLTTSLCSMSRSPTTLCRLRSLHKTEKRSHLMSFFRLLVSTVQDFVSELCFFTLAPRKWPTCATDVGERDDRVREGIVALLGGGPGGERCDEMGRHCTGCGEILKSGCLSAPRLIPVSNSAMGARPLVLFRQQLRSSDIS